MNVNLEELEKRYEGLHMRMEKDYTVKVMIESDMTFSSHKIKIDMVEDFLEERFGY